MPLLVYNLFPTLAGRLAEWVPHATRARAMGFDWLYLNPVHYPGFSGSLYAVKDYERLHPVLGQDSGSPLGDLGPVVRRIRGLGLAVMMDLVINHTARDSPLVAARPGWYRRDQRGEVLSPSAIDPDNATRVTVWGDLVEIDNHGAEDREGLWAFWERLVHRALDLGFSGFRCDAAYKVPAALWRRLIGAARARDSRAVFVAETLGCRLEEIAGLASAGFDYFYNSSKWWDFVAPWCLEQHEQFRAIAPSIAFPESHDTPRLAAESGGSEAVQRQRYAFAAVFSAGVQVTIGYEYGFRRPLDVVATRPEHWEPRRFDLVPFITRVNRLKRTHPLFHGEGVFRRLHSEAGEVTVLERRSDEAGTHRGLVLVNRDPRGDRQVGLAPGWLPPDARLVRVCRDDAPPTGEPVPERVPLGPAEVALVIAPGP